jgi:hypothetical protein
VTQKKSGLLPLVSIVPFSIDSTSFRSLSAVVVTVTTTVIGNSPS